jgi:hypothetical protein
MVEDALPFGTDDLRVDRQVDPQGRIGCFVSGCTQLLRVPGRSRGSGDVCPAHGIRCHKSGTYTYDDPLRNIIAGKHLVERMVRAGKKLTGKAETHRLGHENSEDAVSWNVFRSLQELGLLGLAVEVLTGSVAEGEPELFTWGLRIPREESAEMQDLRARPTWGPEEWSRLRWKGLADARNLLEPIDVRSKRPQQQTEPDVVLFAPPVGWIFVEAKFGSATDCVKKRETAKIEKFVKRYGKACGATFDCEAIEAAKADPTRFPRQLLRNVAFAEVIRGQAPARVVALVRSGAVGDTDWADRANRFLVPGAQTRVHHRTWEDLYRALPARADAKLARLRRYMQTKSLYGEPAFDVGPVPPAGRG